MYLKLIVIRTPEPKILAEFYTKLGLVFEYHKHGNSPYHYAAIVDKSVLEIYPLTKNQAMADSNLRLGFAVDNFETVIQSLKNDQAIFSSEPIETDYGLMAVITDPDGRKIEIYKH